MAGEETPTLPRGPELAADCLLYLIRHGATANNLANPPRLQGLRRDDVLADQGVEQAQRTARLLSRVGIGAVYSSPLARARQTAAWIGRAHGMEVVVDEALREVDVGRWEGKSWHEIEQDEPEAYRRFVHDPQIHPYGGGENLEQVRQRVMPAVHAIAARHTGHRVVVVAHNVVNRVLLGAIWGLPMSLARRITQDNGGVSIIRFTNGVARVETVNIRFHLESP